MQPRNSRNPDRHRRVREIFDGALALPVNQRPAYVQQQSYGDAALESEVGRLLNAVQSAQQGGFLEQPVWKRQAAVAPVQDGMTFGSYRVVRRLGGGGMGAVYLVERSDDVFRKTAALKVVRPECMTPELLRRFDQERRILAELDHPNIARIIDGGSTSDGLPYFVMDYVKGEHIDKYCSTRRFSVDQKLRLFMPVCNAVEYLHSHRIIHRDLKPSNIIVTPNGNVKLLDFGIAKALSDSTKATKTTRVMTPGYASPEQVTGHGISPASDVYSLAILLYELLTGCRPFPESDTPATLQPAAPVRNPVPPSTMAGTNAAHVSAENPSQLRHRLEGDLDTIILMALRNEPQRRYPNAGEFVADIERHLNGRPVSARNDSALYRAAKFVSRNRVRIATVALICALFAWGLYLTILVWSERHKTDEARQQIHQASAHQQDIIQQAGNTLMLPPALRQAELDDVRGVNESYSGPLARAIELRPGMTPERADLIAQGTRYLDVVRNNSGNDPAVLREVAQGYVTLGDLEGYPKRANLGDRAAALEMYGKARGVLQLVPQDDQVRRLLQTVNDHAAAARIN